LDDFEEMADWIFEEDPPTLNSEELEVLNRDLAACTIEEDDIGLYL
jgi:hypothetical protein